MHLSAPGAISDLPDEVASRYAGNIRLAASGTIYKWEFEQGRQQLEVAVDGPLISDDDDSVLDAALAGVVLAFVIEDEIAPLLQAGALKRVLEDWCEPFPGFYLYYPGRRQVSPALGALIDGLRVPIRRRQRGQEERPGQER